MIENFAKSTQQGGEYTVLLTDLSNTLAVYLLSYEQPIYANRFDMHSFDQCGIQRTFGHSFYMIHKILLVEKRRAKAFEQTEGVFNVVGTWGVWKIYVFGTDRTP